MLVFVRNEANRYGFDMTTNEKQPNILDPIAIPGSKVGVLLIHSFGGAPMELRSLARAFGRLGYTVHCPMIPGMADGTDISNLSEWTHWYGYAEDALQALRQKCDTVIVGGVSMGSMLAARLAARRPQDTQGLMLFAPIMWPNGWAIPWGLHFFKLVTARWFANLFRFTLKPPYGIKDERVRRFVIDSLSPDGRPPREVFKRSGGVVFELKRLAADVSRRLGGIRQHTAIFHPRQDDQSNLSVVAKLQKRLGGLVETHVLDDCYHRVTLDRQRAYVEERAVDFAARVVRQVEAQAALVRIKDAAKAPGASSAAAD